MSAPKFSICIIAKNEEKTLPRLLNSLKEFIDRGGDVCVLDTGSTDNTVSIAKDFYCNVCEAGDKFVKSVLNANKINKEFIVNNEPDIVKQGDTYFNFSEARNYTASMSKNKIVFWYDADEVATKMDIDKINTLIDQGVDQFEYNFVFAHDQFGHEVVKFIQCKAYDKDKMQWKGIVHELVTPLPGASPNRMYIDESVYKLSHFQNHETGRHIYLTGLAVDCFFHPKEDRQSHYFARELFWSGRLHSALKEFKRHANMNGWAAERAESFLFIGDICGQLNNPEQQAAFYNAAFYIDSGRNAALIKLALFYRHNKNYSAAICFAKAALELQYTGFYADNLSFYRELPHEILYQCYGYIGKIEESQKHIIKALEFQPYNSMYLSNTKFYFEYPDNGIEGWMRFPELQWLYNEAKKHTIIVEVGSWKGKSTHALLSGCKGKVYSVDTWQGSEDLRDSTNWMAKKEDVYSIFVENTKTFNHSISIPKSSVDAAQCFQDDSIDMVFIDAGHDYKSVKEDILAWLPKVKEGGIICGHDYQQSWMSVIQAVNEILGKPDGTCDSIWWLKKEKQHTMHTETKIPKTIYTCWFSEDGTAPDEIKKCITTQIDLGYDHVVISEAVKDFSSTKYMDQCLNSKHEKQKWVKLTDYLRMKILYENGGIFLDADVEVLPGKNFDHLLNEEMFVGLESANWNAGMVVLGTAVIGAKPGHPLIKKWIDEVEANFRGDDDKCYESSMHILNKLGVEYQDKMKLLEPDVFYPYNHFSGETHITENTIAIHHFKKSWVEESLTVQLTNKIKKEENFVFIKRGDGEIACMNGEVGANCDGHPYSKLLAGLLVNSYRLLNGKSFAVDFDDQKNYNCILHRTDSNLSEVSAFYKCIAESGKKIFLIAPLRLWEMAKILGAEHVSIPELNVFASRNVIIDNLPVLQNAIYLFCAGMPAKVMISDMYEKNPEATYIDCGSAFDPIVSQTRTFQISKEQFLSLYRKDNFSIPQEIHPERLYTVQNIGEAKIVYDLGCGSHKSIPSAIGMDIRAVTDVQGSIDTLPFESKSADAIISRHSLEHVLDPAKAIKEWIRVLKPGGRMVIVLPDHGSINTIDPYYGNGEHLHAYTMESLSNFISLFPDIYIIKSEIVLSQWSFGAVICRLPKVAIIIPQLGREEGLKKCIASIEALNYPKHLIETNIIGGFSNVPRKMKEGINKSSGDFICYAANDMFFEPNSLLNAIVDSIVEQKALVSFNEGEILPDEGNICCHFIIRKNFIDEIGGEIFDTRLHHCGADNLLWARAKKLNQAFHSLDAKIVHNHFSYGKSEMDFVYEKGWLHVDEDRKKLSEILQTEHLNNGKE